MKGFHVSASGAIQGHHGPLVPISSMFGTLSKREIFILATFNLSSANAFNLVTFIILLFGKGLKASVYLSDAITKKQGDHQQATISSFTKNLEDIFFIIPA